MFKTLTAMCLALLLTGCGLSRKQTKPLTLPQPPSEALLPCTVPELTGGNAADVETDLKMRGAAIAQCEAKRRRLVDVWPK